LQSGVSACGRTDGGDGLALPGNPWAVSAQPGTRPLRAALLPPRHQRQLRGGGRGGRALLRCASRRPFSAGRGLLGVWLKALGHVALPGRRARRARRDLGRLPWHAPTRRHRSLERPAGAAELPAERALTAADAAADNRAATACGADRASGCSSSRKQQESTTCWRKSRTKRWRPCSGAWRQCGPSSPARRCRGRRQTTSRWRSWRCGSR